MGQDQRPPTTTMFGVLVPFSTSEKQWSFLKQQMHRSTKFEVETVFADQRPSGCLRGRDSGLRETDVGSGGFMRLLSVHNQQPVPAVEQSDHVGSKRSFGLEPWLSVGKGGKRARRGNVKHLLGS